MKNDIYFDEIEESLVNEIKKGNKVAANKMIQRYEPLTWKVASLTIVKFPSIPLEMEDLVNQLRADICNLTLEFDESRNIKYSSYLNYKLDKNAINHCRSYISNKHKAINFYSSIEDDKETMVDHNYEDLAEELYKELETMKEFSEIEIKTLRKYLNGINPEQASEQLGISKSSYYRHLNITKEKIKKIYPIFDI